MPHPQRHKTIIAATLFLMGVNDMSNHEIGFESTQIGAAPDGWTATLTGSGDPKWTVESDETAPSKSRVLKQVTRANALEDNVVLYKTVKGVRSPLDIVGRKGGYGVNIAVPASTWHTLRIDFKASRFSVSFNGRQLFEVEDSTFTDAGKVGLWTKADSVTLFDEVIYGGTK